MPGVGLRPLPLLPPGSLASQVCSSSQELCRLPQRRPLPRETPDSLRRLVTGMRIRSGRKCCPAAPRRWSLCPLVCVASVAHRFLPTDLKLYALLSLCVGRGVALLPPPTARRRGPFCFMPAAHAPSPPRARRRARRRAPRRARPRPCGAGAGEDTVLAAFSARGSQPPRHGPHPLPRGAASSRVGLVCACVRLCPWSSWALSATLSAHVSLLDLGNYYSFIVNTIAGKGGSPSVLKFQNSLPNSYQIPLKIPLEYFAY